MTTPSAVKAWAIKAPGKDGRIDPMTIRATRKEAIEATVTDWQWCYDHGFRCVRVTVQEMQ